MFKNYLTYQFAQSFHRLCGSLTVETSIKERLMKSAGSMLHHFGRSIYTRDAKDEARWLVVSLICLRDCKDVLGEGGIKNHELDSIYAVLHGRMEQLCLKAADAERGQLRMLG